MGLQKPVWWISPVINWSPRSGSLILVTDQDLDLNPDPYSSSKVQRNLKKKVLSIL
jgi:hypothetical protein